MYVSVGEMSTAIHKHRRSGRRRYPRAVAGIPTHPAPSLKSTIKDSEGFCAVK